MSKFLVRDENIKEEMDDLACDQVILENTYKQFSKINGFLSRWKWIYRKFLKPVMLQKEKPTLLDIGFGGGDVVVSIAKWALRDGINLKILGIETDKRAVEYVNKNIFYNPEVISFRHASLKDLIQESASFDIVLSNHVLHHLSELDLKTFLEDSSVIANKFVIHNDLLRSKIAYNLFYPSKFVFRNSFIFEDGLSSIRRAFSENELEEAGGEKWTVEKVFPFRIITYQNK
jgi:2-polyprenyl-3-methyl-5-hydroxy-6-metoxy-1,4-benzoquinol methylase